MLHWSHDSIPCSARHPPRLRLPSLPRGPPDPSTSPLAVGFPLTDFAVQWDARSPVLSARAALHRARLARPGRVSLRTPVAQSARDPLRSSSSLATTGSGRPATSACVCTEPLRGPFGPSEYLTLARGAAPTARPAPARGAGGTLKKTDSQLFREKDRELDRWMRKFVHDNGLEELYAARGDPEMERLILRDEITVGAQEVKQIVRQELDSSRQRQAQLSHVEGQMAGVDTLAASLTGCVARSSSIRERHEKAIDSHCRELAESLAASLHSEYRAAALEGQRERQCGEIVEKRDELRQRFDDPFDVDLAKALLQSARATGEGGDGAQQQPPPPPTPQQQQSAHAMGERGDGMDGGGAVGECPADGHLTAPSADGPPTDGPPQVDVAPVRFYAPSTTQGAIDVMASVTERLAQQTAAAAGGAAGGGHGDGDGAPSRPRTLQLRLSQAASKERRRAEVLAMASATQPPLPPEADAPVDVPPEAPRPLRASELHAGRAHLVPRASDTAPPVIGLWPRPRPPTEPAFGDGGFRRPWPAGATSPATRLADARSAATAMPRARGLDAVDGGVGYGAGGVVHDETAAPYRLSLPRRPALASSHASSRPRSVAAVQ